MGTIIITNSFKFAFNCTTEIQFRSRLFRDFHYWKPQVDSEGFEPPTSRVQGERSTNWAKSPVVFSVLALQEPLERLHRYGLNQLIQCE